MKQLLIVTFAFVALSSGTVFAQQASNPVKPTKKTAVTRAEKARRQIAADLHLRGSNIPPAFSATGSWSR